MTNCKLLSAERRSWHSSHLTVQNLEKQPNRAIFPLLRSLFYIVIIIIIVAQGSGENGAVAPLRILSFIHSLDSDSDGDGCPFQSFVRSLTRSVSLSSLLFSLPPLSICIECAARMTNERNLARCWRKGTRHSRRRSCSYQTAARRLAACKIFLYNRSKQSASKFFFFSLLIRNKCHQQYSDNIHI